MGLGTNYPYLTKTNPNLSRRHGLVVLAEDSRTRGCGFESC